MKLRKTIIFTLVIMLIIPHNVHAVDMVQNNTEEDSILFENDENIEESNPSEENHLEVESNQEEDELYNDSESSQNEKSFNEMNGQSDGEVQSSTNIETTNSSEETEIFFTVGDVDDRVIDLKQMLIRLGFGGMNVNNIYGSFTSQRVSQFQEYYGLPVTGDTDEQTFDKITEILSTPFQEGERHPDTVLLKQKLTLIGYGGMNINEIYGSFTALRVSQFQADHGLKAHGIADQKTLDKIEEVLERLYQVESLSSDNILFVEGDVDERVIDLKRMLIRLGYGGMNVNEVYGSFTALRVSQFQEYYGLPATGVTDVRTFDKMTEILSTPFQEGERHPDTVLLKKKLHWLGYGGMNLNEVYGSFTALRVSQFQADHGLKNHGIADQKTLGKMDEVLESIFRVGSTHPSVIAFKRDITRLGFGGMNINEVYGSFTAQRVRQLQEYYGLEVTGRGDVTTLLKIEEILSTPLQEGISHPDTVQLKQKLSRLDFGGMNINEVYGSFTAQRVRQFQSYYGLVVNGIADERTLAKLDEVLDTPFQEGVSHPDTIILKQKLHRLGYGGMNLNEVYGSFTALRVSQFQADHGLRAHGIADQITLARIDEELSSIFRVGSEHNSVIQFKRDLTRLGFGGMNLNEIYGSFTAQQVRQFQQYYGLEVTGNGDLQTLLKLDEIINSPLQLGRDHNDTVELKQNLTRLGFGGMDIDTRFDAVTEQKVREFQQYYGLVVNGIADNRTIEKINEILSSPFQEGMRHPDTIQLKEKLTRLHFGGMNINDLYGSFTAQRVSEFQSYYGLAVNGIADGPTWNKLNEILSSPFQEGVEHPDTIDLKRNLIKLGYGGMTVNELYGSFTAQRVSEFQADNGLRAHGIADEVTLRLIERKIEMLQTPSEIITYTQYPLTLAEAVQRQSSMDPPPQTDMHRFSNVFIHSSVVNVVEGVTNARVNLRTGPSTSSSIHETVNAGTTLVVQERVNDNWYEIRYDNNTLYVSASFVDATRVSARGTANFRSNTTLSSSSLLGSVSVTRWNNNGNRLRVISEHTGANTGGSDLWYEVRLGQWTNARQEDFLPFLDPSRNDRFQHLILDESVGVTASELNNVLNGRGIFHGRGQAFIDAGRTHGVNEIYLIAHAMLESGNGTSGLATGIEIGRNSNGQLVRVTSSNRSSLTDIRTTYNMYGIGANDDNPYTLGAIFAYNRGWFTPEEAIIGGAEFIRNDYFNRGQNTLYKMRWNHLYRNSWGGFPQYATDMGWATKQVPRIKQLYESLDNPVLRFNIVQYQ